MANESRKQTLIDELQSARTQIACYATALRHDLNVTARLKSGVARNPVVWFGGAAVIGLLFSRILSSRRTVVLKGPAVGKEQVEKAGKAAFALTVLKLAFDFAKPALVNWVRTQVTERRAARSAAAR